MATAAAAFAFLCTVTFSLYSANCVCAFLNVCIFTCSLAAAASAGANG